MVFPIGKPVVNCHRKIKYKIGNITVGLYIQLRMIIMDIKKIAIVAVIIVVVAALAVGLTMGGDDEKPSGPITVTANGKTVTLEKPAENIIIYPKYIAEAIILMDATDKVAGVSKTISTDSNYSSYYADVTNLGANNPATGFDKVLELQPDLIITYKTYDNTNAYNSGIPVIEIGASKIDEVQTDIEILGKVLGMEDKAKKILDWFNKYYDKVQKSEATSGKKFLLEAASKTKVSFMGPTSTMGNLLKLVDGKNVIESGSYEYLSFDTIIPTNPDVIFILEYNASWNESYLDSYRDGVCSRAGWDQINAVKTGEVYSVSNDIIGGIRSVIGSMFMLSFIDPAFSTLDVSKLVDEYNSTFGTHFNNKMVYKG